MSVPVDFPGGAPGRGRRAFLGACFVGAALAATMPARAADLATETRPIGTFRTVKLIGAANLVLRQSDTPSLTVQGDKAVLPYLIAETRGDELVLRYEPRERFVWWSSDADKNDRGPRFILSARTIDRIATAGNGDVKADAWTAQGDFEISVAGSSDIRIDGLAARKLLVRIAGAGDVMLGGGVLEQNVTIAGSGDYHGGKLQSASAVIAIRGSGDATLSARDSLTVSIAGSGDVKYYGHPAITKSIAGSGSITGLGDKP